MLPALYLVQSQTCGVTWRPCTLYVETPRGLALPVLRQFTNAMRFWNGQVLQREYERSQKLPRTITVMR